MVLRSSWCSPWGRVVCSEVVAVSSVVACMVGPCRGVVVWSVAERVSCALAESSRVAAGWLIVLSVLGVVPFAVVSWLGGPVSAWRVALVAWLR